MSKLPMWIEGEKQFRAVQDLYTAVVQKVESVDQRVVLQQWLDDSRPKNEPRLFLNNWREIYESRRKEIAQLPSFELLIDTAQTLALADEEQYPDRLAEATKRLANEES